MELKRGVLVSSDTAHPHTAGRAGGGAISSVAPWRRPGFSFQTSAASSRNDIVETHHAISIQPCGSTGNRQVRH